MIKEISNIHIFLDIKYFISSSLKIKNNLSTHFFFMSKLDYYIKLGGSNFHQKVDVFDSCARYF